MARLIFLRRALRWIFTSVTQAARQDHAGKQNQAPRQVFGVVTLHAVCEE